MAPTFLSDTAIPVVSIERAGDRKGSVGLWERALVSDPDHPEALFAVSRRYLESEYYHLAARAAERLAGQPEWRARADRLLGSIHFAQHDADGAAVCWQRALDRRLVETDVGSLTDIRNRPGARSTLSQASRPGSISFANRAGP